MLKSRELSVLTSLAILMLLLSHCTQGAPSSSRDNAIDRLLHKRVMSPLAKWLSMNAEFMNRMRRAHQIDAGFLSRHNAYANYQKSYAAQRQASDPWGPGRRK